MLASLRELWSGSGAAFIQDPKARIAEVIESRVLAHPSSRAA